MHDPTDDDDDAAAPDDIPTRAERPATSVPPSAPGEGRAASDASSPSRPGTVQDLGAELQARGFGERYELRRLLGSGGVGEVHLCHDRQIGRDVALKRLHPGAGSTASTGAAGRFLREARIQGQLEHPAVVPVYDLGLTPQADEFFTMKRVSGRTLQQILDGLRKDDPELQKAYPRSKLLGIFRQVCLAVDYAHARGVIHRDLKPTNVMVGHFGEVYVLDWGLAKVLASDRPSIHAPAPEDAETVEGQILGTPGYMAPEQLVGAPSVDERADVYALGALLFELLTLHPLHPRTTQAAIVRSTQVGADARPSVRVPELDTPPELEDLCVRATRLEAAERDITARDLADAVDRFLEGDRDLEMRRRLAARHVEAAERHANVALEGEGEAPTDDRRRALQEAGRALALDPSSTAASRVLMKLMLEPPAEPPPAVHDAIERDEVEEVRFAARSGAIGYLVFLALLVFLVWIGVRSFGALGLIAIPVLGASATCIALLPHDHYKPWMGMTVAVLGFTAIAAVSGLFGALVLVPGLAAANVMALNLGALRRQRGVILALGCLSVLVPFALEWAGVLPPAYRFEGHRMVVLPVVQDFPELWTRLELLTAALFTVVVPALTVWRTSDGLARARQSVHTQSWQLSQLVPEATPER